MPALHGQQHRTTPTSTACGSVHQTEWLLCDPINSLHLASWSSMPKTWEGFAYFGSDGPSSRISNWCACNQPMQQAHGNAGKPECKHVGTSSHLAGLGWLRLGCSSTAGSTAAAPSCWSLWGHYCPSPATPISPRPTLTQSWPPWLPAAPAGGEMRSTIQQVAGQHLGRCRPTILKLEGLHRLPEHGPIRGDAVLDRLHYGHRSFSAEVFAGRSSKGCEQQLRDLPTFSASSVDCPLVPTSGSSSDSADQRVSGSGCTCLTAAAAAA